MTTSADTTQTEKTSTIQYTHVPVALGETNEGYLTLAYDVAGDLLEYGVAFCAPTDNFSRPKGRLIAKGRLNSERRCGVISGISEHDDLIAKMIEDIEKGNYQMPAYKKATDINTPRWYFEGTV